MEERFFQLNPNLFQKAQTMNTQMKPLVFAPVSVSTELQDQMRAGRKAKTINDDLDRPLFVRGDGRRNVVSLAIVFGLVGLMAPLAYFGAVLVINLVLLTHLREMALV